MTEVVQDSSRLRAWWAFGEPVKVVLSVLCFLALSCVSLIEVARDVHPDFGIAFDPRHALSAAFSVTALSCWVPILALAQFSFGYLVSFYMLAITAGYLWLSFFSPLEYDHSIARWSAAISFVTFLIPTTLISRPLQTYWTLTKKQMDRLVACLAFACALTVLNGARYDFHVIGFITGEAVRSQLTFPAWMRYPLSISSTALVPFCYAWFLLRKNFLCAVIILGVGLAIYPITVNKTALLAPFWLAALTVLLKIGEIRLVVVLTLLLPLTLGLAAKVIDPSSPEMIFRMINFRMLAIPASGLDHYYHFFSTHPLTHFCQVSVIGRLFDCARPDQLGVTMAKEYAIGNYNASLFATEGIASVGPLLSPLVTAICGIVITIGNLASAGLKSRFVFLSGSMLALVLMNVPLSTTMLTAGGMIIFVLWYITPRDLTDPGERKQLASEA